MPFLDTNFIKQRIPHRSPFLWLDNVSEINDDFIKAEKLIPEDLDIFQGHYPDHPIMPGVLLCEAVFQAGALLISERMSSGKNENVTEGSSFPVLTRIVNAKFKREVKPGDIIEIMAKFKDKVGPAWFLKGTVKVGGKTAVLVEFACMQKGES